MSITISRYPIGDVLNTVKARFSRVSSQHCPFVNRWLTHLQNAFFRFFKLTFILSSFINMKYVSQLLRTSLHKLARIMEKNSPLKGELVEISFVKRDNKVTYTYTKVKE